MPRLFKPGESGNPNGRPHKSHSITESFKQLFRASPEAKQKIIDAIYKSALSGDSTAQKLLWNYMDGMPLQKTDVTIKIPQPIYGAKSMKTIENTSQLIEGEVEEE